MKPEYAEYQKMIFGLARKHSRKHERPFDEVLSDINFIFTNSIDRWDSNKGKFSTYLYHRVNWWMWAEHQDREREKRNDAGKMAEQLPNPSPNIEKRVCFISTLETLSDDAKVVVNIIFETPNDLYKWAMESPRPVITITLIKRYLRKIGWGWEHINRTIKEVKTLVRQEV